MSLERVLFSSRKDLESSKGFNNVAVISIINPGDPAVSINNNFGPSLRLIFDDIDESKDGKEIFTIEKADKIWDFTENLPSNIDTIWVHCTFGVSRSAGVAKAIAENYDLPYPEKYAIYNKRVYRILRQTMLQRLYPDADGLCI